MGRAENRQKIKRMKKKMTKEQYESFQKEVTEKIINIEIDERYTYLKFIIADVMMDVLRKNRISEERAKKINREIWEEVQRRYLENEKRILKQG